MDRSFAEAILATAVFLATIYLVVTGEGIVPTVLGSYFLGGVATVISGISLGVALYQWDGRLHIFHAEEHVVNPEGLTPKLSSMIVNMAGILTIIGLISIFYGLMSAII